MSRFGLMCEGLPMLACPAKASTKRRSSELGVLQLCDRHARCFDHGLLYMQERPSDPDP